MTVVFWGTSFAAVKIGIGSLSSVQFLFIRILFASILFALILAFTPKDKRHIHTSDLLYIVYLSFIGIGGYFIVQYTALEYTSTVNAALLIGVSPILVAIYSGLFRSEKIGLQGMTSILLCIVGIFLIITRGDFSSISFNKTIFGDILVLINAFMFATFCIGANKILKKYDPFVVVSYINIFALFILAPLAFTSNFLSPIPLMDKLGEIDLPLILSALYLAVTCTIFAYYIWYTAIKEIGASKTAVFNYLNPLTAAIVSALLFDEGITYFTIFGGICIIGGVALNNIKATQKKDILFSKSYKKANRFNLKIG